MKFRLVSLLMAWIVIYSSVARVEDHQTGIVVFRTPDQPPQSPISPTIPFDPTSPTRDFASLADSGAYHPTVLQIIERNPQFSIFAQLLFIADVTKTITGLGPFTVFAPTDTAFSVLSVEAYDELIKRENRGILADILKDHIVIGEIKADELKTTTTLQAISGKLLNVKKVGEDIFVEGAKIIRTNIFGSNGIVHTIDKLLISK